MLETREELPSYLTKMGYRIGAEIGVSEGIFSHHLLSNWNGKLYSIDAWRHFEGIIDINNKDHNTQLNSLAHTFMQMYKFQERSVIIRDLSNSASRLFQDGSLDFVYIDAGHDYNSIHTDLLVWYPKVRKGGLFCGHDYLDGLMVFDKDDPSKNGRIEVKRAVDDFCAWHNLECTQSKEYLPSWFINL